MKRKLLSTILKERTDTIEYRAIRKHLMTAAQNNKSEFRILKITDKTIIQLQNEGLAVERINEFEHEKWKISW